MTGLRCAAMSRRLHHCRIHERGLTRYPSVMKVRRFKNIPVISQESRPIGVLNARDDVEVLMMRRSTRRPCRAAM